MEKHSKLSKIILYFDGATSNLSLYDIKEYLSSRFIDVDISLRNDFFKFRVENKNQMASKLVHRLASIKVRDITDPKKSIPPLIGEIAIEKRMLSEPERSLAGILYDGFKLHELMQELLPSSEINNDICHIIITQRLFGTFARNDRRYHARTILCGYPSIISSSGIVEAPAKPREYYQIKQKLLMHGITTVDGFVPEELKKKYMKYNDPRITEVMKGYIMQILSYHLYSEPFCPEPKCRLYNAHWQEEMLQAQLSSPEFCTKHNELFGSVDKKMLYKRNDD